MKTAFVILAVLLPLCLAKVDEHKQRMLKENKTPKQLNSVCDECKTLVGRVDDALKDPTKMAELKILLRGLCEQVHRYREECVLLVDNLDTIAKKIEPMLRNPDKLCTDLHMCHNSRLERLHRVALLYAKRYMNRVDKVNGLVCDECVAAAEELKDLLEERTTQQEVQDFIQNYVCKHLGGASGMCTEFVETVLPELLQELSQALQNGKQVCTDIGLCSAGADLLIRGVPLRNADRANRGNAVDHARLPRPGAHRLQSFLSTLKRLQTKNGIFMTCLECEIAFDGILAGLHTETIMNGVSTDLRGLVCGRLPVSFQNGCNDFLQLYLKTVLVLTVDQLTAQKVCTMFHACTAQSFAQVTRLSAAEKRSAVCDACVGITGFVGRELRDSTFQGDIETGVKSALCDRLPESVHNLCDNLVDTYVPILMNKATALVNSDAVCKNELHMCTADLLQKLKTNNN